MRAIKRDSVKFGWLMQMLIQVLAVDDSKQHDLTKSTGRAGLHQRWQVPPEVGTRLGLGS